MQPRTDIDSHFLKSVQNQVYSLKEIDLEDAALSMAKGYLK